jgi:YHS domain-containing protein
VIRLIPVFALALLLNAMCSAQPVRDNTMRVDVVELLNHGRDVEGDDRFAAVHGKYTYWFAGEDNMMTFLMNAEKYEIQMGGACARMGPLSGGGTTKLYAVHDGKLYLFASESCRMTFQKSPEQFIDQADPPIETNEESRAQARMMLGKAVDAISCVAGIDNLTTYREVLARDEESGGTNYHITNTLTLQFPNGQRTELCWNEACWGNVVVGKDGWMISGDNLQPMHEQQRMALRLESLHPLMILRHRDAKDMLMKTDGAVRTITVPDEGEVKVNVVTVHRDGITVTLGFDDQHRVRLMSARGRGANSTLGTVDRIYSKFHGIEGMRVPGRVDVFFNGEHAAKESGEFVEQVINDPADAERFLKKPSVMPAPTANES